MPGKETSWVTLPLVSLPLCVSVAILRSSQGIQLGPQACGVTCGSQAGSEAARWDTLGHWVWRLSLPGLKEGWPLCGVQGALLTV